MKNLRNVFVLGVMGLFAGAGGSVLALEDAEPPQSPPECYPSLAAVPTAMVNSRPFEACDDDDENCRCTCVQEFGWCYECPGQPDDCVYASCVGDPNRSEDGRGIQCRYTYGFDCAILVPDSVPAWVEDCS